MTHPRRILFTLLFLWWTLAAAVPACEGGKLLPGAESALVSAELELCDAFLPLSGLAQPIAALACPGSEAALKYALDRVPSPPPAPAPEAGAPIAPPTHPLVLFGNGRAAVFHGSKMIGVAPPSVARAIHTPEVQAALDAFHADAGR